MSSENPVSVSEADVWGEEEEALTETFDSAAAFVRGAAASLEPDILLFLYSRFKQSTCGPCAEPRPGFFDFQGKRKWDAWNNLGNLSSETAMTEYIDKVKDLNLGWVPGAKESDGGVGQKMSKMRVDEEEEAETGWLGWAKMDGVRPEEVERWLETSDGRESELEVRDASGMSALHCASDRGLLDLLRLLLERGAEVNAQATDGQTPLHFAVSCQHFHVSELLLKSGADPTIVDGDGQTCFAICDDPSIAALLTKYHSA